MLNNPFLFPLRDSMDGVIVTTRWNDGASQYQTDLSGLEGVPDSTVGRYKSVQEALKGHSAVLYRLRTRR